MNFFLKEGMEEPVTSFSSIFTNFDFQDLNCIELMVWPVLSQCRVMHGVAYEGPGTGSANEAGVALCPHGTYILTRK